MTIGIVFKKDQSGSASYHKKFDEELKDYFGADIFEAEGEWVPKAYCAKWKKDYRPFCIVKNIDIEVFVEFFSLNAWLVEGYAGVLEAWQMLTLAQKMMYDDEERILRRPYVRRDTMARRSAGKAQYPDPLGSEFTTGNHTEDLATLKKRAPVEAVDSSFDVRFLTTPPLTVAESERMQIASFGVPEKAWLEESQGEGVNIYLLDSGFVEEAKKHPEFSETVGKEGRIKGWLHHPTLSGNETDYDRQTTDQEIRGTCGISKILGRRGGLAKRANVWIAPSSRMPWLWSSLTHIDQLVAIKGHILSNREKDPRYKALVHINQEILEYRAPGERQEYYWRDPNLRLTKNEEAWIGRVSDLADEALKSLLKVKDIIMVTSAGGPTVRFTSSSWPARRGHEYGNMIVVGSVNTLGRVSGVREDEIAKIYAIGTGVEVPFLRILPDKTFIQGGYESVENGNHAALAVTGILATHLSANKEWNTAAAMRKLYGDSYPRFSGGPRVAWTGVRPPSGKA
ncbi:hypothetical protein TWF718_005293 [Orbilia javanica]|uniref:Uncharacterized protein n=1 Tax=Orbilia javanica TaxID=47235 RepID=A0AAN8NWN9_9PEZI